MPESQPPSALPKSQGGPYIAAIIVLIVLILGLVWYRFSKKKPPPPQAPVVQTVSAVATPPPAMLNIPAPPEMDAGEDAAEDAGKKKHVKVGRSLCSGTCNGTAPAALRSALRAAGGAARGCYEKALRTNEMLQGRMVVAVRVASNGRVCSASVVSDSVGSSQVSSCVMGMFRGRTFPGATGGRCVDVNVPLSFKPKGKK